MDTLNTEEKQTIGHSGKPLLLDVLATKRKGKLETLTLQITETHFPILELKLLSFPCFFPSFILLSCLKLTRASRNVPKSQNQYESSYFWSSKLFLKLLILLPSFLCLSVFMFLLFLPPFWFLVKKGHLPGWTVVSSSSLGMVSIKAGLTKPWQIRISFYLPNKTWCQNQ